MSANTAESIPGLRPDSPDITPISEATTKPSGIRSVEMNKSTAEAFDHLAHLDPVTANDLRREDLTPEQREETDSAWIEFVNTHPEDSHKFIDRDKKLKDLTIELLSKNAAKSKSKLSESESVEDTNSVNPSGEITDSMQNTSSMEGPSKDEVREKDNAQIEEVRGEIGREEQNRTSAEDGSHPEEDKSISEATKEGEEGTIDASVDSKDSKDEDGVIKLDNGKGDINHQIVEHLKGLPSDGKIKVELNPGQLAAIASIVKFADGAKLGNIGFEIKDGKLVVGSEIDGKWSIRHLFRKPSVNNKATYTVSSGGVLELSSIEDPRYANGKKEQFEEDVKKVLDINSLLTDTLNRSLSWEEGYKGVVKDFSMSDKGIIVEIGKMKEEEKHEDDKSSGHH